MFFPWEREEKEREREKEKKEGVNKKRNIMLSEGTNFTNLSFYILK